MTTPLPLCVIGGGSIGQRHVEVAQLSGLIHLTAVVEPNEASRKALLDKGLPAVAEIDEVPEPTRAAVVATPTPAHHDCSVAALDRGWATIVEKPITGSLEEGRALIAHAEKKGLPLFTGHHRRCHPFSIAARDALARIGEPVGVQAFWSLRKHDSYYDVAWRRKPGHGPLLSNLSHELDLLNFLFGGGPVEVTALASSARRGFEIEDTAALAMRFGNGALGSVLISDAGASPWAFEAASSENPDIAGSGEDYLRLTGTKGSLAFPSLTLWTRQDGNEIEWSRPLDRLPGAGFARIDPLLAQIERFAKVVAGGTDDVLCSATDGLTALEMTLATALSARERHPVARGEVPGDFRGT